MSPVRRLCLACSMLADLIDRLEFIGSTTGTGSGFAFSDLPEAQRDLFATLLADEVKLQRIHRASSPEGLRHELFFWVRELSHMVSSVAVEANTSSEKGAA